MSENILINDGDLPPAGHSDTTPPTVEHHGFLEQFEALSHESLEKLESVAELGLATMEATMLFKVSLKMMTMAVPYIQEEDLSPESKAELETLVNELLALDSPNFRSNP